MCDINSKVCFVQNPYFQKTLWKEYVWIHIIHKIVGKKYLDDLLGLLLKRVESLLSHEAVDLWMAVKQH